MKFRIRIRFFLSRSGFDKKAGSIRIGCVDWVVTCGFGQGAGNDGEEEGGEDVHGQVNCGYGQGAGNDREEEGGEEVHGQVHKYRLHKQQQQGKT